MKDLTAMCANLPIQVRLYWVALHMDFCVGGEYQLYPYGVTPATLWKEVVESILVRRCLRRSLSESDMAKDHFKDLDPNGMQLMSLALDLHAFLVVLEKESLLTTFGGYPDVPDIHYFEECVEILQARYDDVSTGKADRDELANGDSSETV